MSANPYNLHDIVNGSDECVEYSSTQIMYYNPKTFKYELYDKDKLKWNDIEEDILTLNEIKQQIKENEKLNKEPLLHIMYDSGLWGVIFLNDSSNWIVYGITIGYA